MNDLIVICSEENEQQSKLTSTLNGYLNDEFLLDKKKKPVIQKLQQQEGRENMLFNASIVDEER